MSESNTTSAIMDLLTEEVKTVPNAPVARRKIEEIPDALVLCEILTVCDACSTEWPHPNVNILGRYDKHYKKIEKWSSLFEQLPREILKIKERSKSCTCCFGYVVLRTGDIEGSI